MLRRAMIVGCVRCSVRMIEVTEWHVLIHLISFPDVLFETLFG